MSAAVIGKSSKTFFIPLQWSLPNLDNFPNHQSLLRFSGLVPDPLNHDLQGKGLGICVFKWLPQVTLTISQSQETLTVPMEVEGRHFMCLVCLEANCFYCRTDPVQLLSFTNRKDRFHKWADKLPNTTYISGSETDWKSTKRNWAFILCLFPWQGQKQF